MRRLCVWPVVLCFLSCSSNEPPRAPAGPVTKASTELADPPRLDPQPPLPDVTVPELVLRVEPRTVDRTASGLERSSWARLLTQPTSGQSVEPGFSVRWLPAPASVDQAWLQLDDGMPRLVSAPKALSLVDLDEELEPLLEGEHRLSWFATDSSGRLLFDRAGQPLLEVRRVFVETPPVEAGRAGQLSAPAADRPRAADTASDCAAASWIAPHGTFNGEQVRDVPLEFWAEHSRTLTVRDERGRLFRTELSPGVYSIGGLSAGDYQLQLQSSGCEPQQVIVTTNPELGARAQP